MKTITLTQGFVALIDEADYDRVSAFKWSATKTKNVYGVRKVRTASGRTTSQRLHRRNLRVCVRGENNGNLRKTRGVSQYKGVTWDSARGLWRAYITIRNTLKFLGRFYDERDAALAYDAAARATFGEFAFCNFPLQEIAHLP